jgi:hypothetical protein
MTLKMLKTYNLFTFQLDAELEETREQAIKDRLGRQPYTGALALD